MAFQKAYVITTLGKHPCFNVHIANDSISMDDGGGPKKRRRLTHLSADEKMLRRKMKNRIAAQTARDRKKVLMDELEEKVAELEEEKQQLLKENAALRHNQAVFEQENLRLKVMSSQTLTSAPVPDKVAAAAAASSSLPSSAKPAAATSLLKRKALASTVVLPCKADSIALRKEPASVALKEPASVALSCKTEPESPGSAVPPVSLPKEQPQDLSRVGMQSASCALTLSLILSCISWKNSALQCKNPATIQEGRQLKPVQNALPSVDSAMTVQNAWHSVHSAMTVQSASDMTVQSASDSKISVQTGAGTEPWWGP